MGANLPDTITSGRRPWEPASRGAVDMAVLVPAATAASALLAATFRI